VSVSGFDKGWSSDLGTRPRAGGCSIWRHTVLEPDIFIGWAPAGKPVATAHVDGTPRLREAASSPKPAGAGLVAGIAGHCFR
jgi:hypothetical protein